VKKNRFEIWLKWVLIDSKPKPLFSQPEVMLAWQLLSFYPSEQQAHIDIGLAWDQQDNIGTGTYDDNKGSGSGLGVLFVRISTGSLSCSDQGQSGRL
jgi:hypothetical protein